MLFSCLVLDPTARDELTSTTFLFCLYVCVCLLLRFVFFGLVGAHMGAQQTLLALMECRSILHFASYLLAQAFHCLVQLELASLALVSYATNQSVDER
mmetsp:Transcript_76085/g.120165  ORF Transcript_76085/g.120165 Transcript_76085/m.120165 type:complete len:98 (+) Transcript_76085:165-458(+)